MVGLADLDPHRRGYNGWRAYFSVESSGSTSGTFEEAL